MLLDLERTRSTSGWVCTNYESRALLHRNSNMRSRMTRVTAFNHVQRGLEVNLSDNGCCGAILITLLAGAGLPMPSVAGPCASEISRLQFEIDAAIEAHAKAGPFGPEERVATDHWQPTPKTLARAEKRLSGWKGGLRSIRALQDAREADRVGDRDRCKQALLAARRVLQADP
jgi:hypothetical protein